MTDIYEKTIQKLQLEVVLLSIFLLVGAMLWSVQIGFAANNLDHHLEHARDDLNGLRETIKQLEAKHA